MEEQWINDLRKKMASHQTPVPPGLWENIESAMKKTAPAPIPLRKRIVMWSSGIGSVAAAVALAFLWFNPENTDQQRLTSQEIVPDITGRTADLAETSTTHEDFLAMSTPSAPKSLVIQQNEISANSQQTSSKVSPAKAVSETSDTPSTVVPTSSEQQTIPTADTEQKEKPRRKEGVNTSFKPVTSSQRSALLATAERPRKHSWELNVFAGNLPHTTHHTSGYSEFVAGTALPQDLSTTFSPIKDLIYSNLGKKIETQKKHRFPIKFGISARYRLSSRWSLESGLTYTFLSSELTSGTDAHHFVTEQNLQFLGLPLMVSYDFWKNKTWNLYVSGGGVLEKCIHGKSTTDFVIDRQQVSTTKKNVMERPLQCSVLGTFGAQLHLSPHFALYAEPGVSYYFDNGSPVETIYKDQPLNFNFKLGFRIHFN